MAKWTSEQSNKWLSHGYSKRWGPGIISKVDEPLYDLEKDDGDIELEYIKFDEIPPRYRSEFIKFYEQTKMQIERRIDVLEDVVILDETNYGALLSDWKNWLKWKLGRVRGRPTPVGRGI